MCVPKITTYINSKTSVCSRSLAGIACSNSAGDMDVSLYDCCVSSSREVYTKDRSLVQMSPTDCVCVSLSVIKRNNDSTPTTAGTQRSD